MEQEEQEREEKEKGEWGGEEGMRKLFKKRRVERKRFAASPLLNPSTQLPTTSTLW